MIERPRVAPSGNSEWRRLEENLPPRAKLPAPLLGALGRFEEAMAFEHLAQRGVEYAEKVLIPEYASALKAHEAEQVLKAPSDWEDFTGPKPDVALLRARAKCYQEARIAVRREVVKASADPRVWDLIEASWLRAHAPIPDTVTMAEARVAEVMRADAVAVIGNAARSVVVAALGATEHERKTWERALKEGVLLDLKAVRDHIAGRTPARLAAEAKAKDDAETKRSSDASFAADNARRRVAGKESE